MLGTSIKREDLNPGDIVYKWHDTGTFGMTPFEMKVIRVNRKTVTCKSLYRDEQGRVPFKELGGFVTWEVQLPAWWEGMPECIQKVKL